MDYIKAIHIAKAKAGLDDDSYRALLMGASGVCSSKEIRSARQYDGVRKAFMTLGVGMPYCRHRNSPLERKAYALWRELHKAGLVEDPAWSAMLSFRKRQFSGQDILMPSQHSHFIEILKAWLARADETES